MQMLRIERMKIGSDGILAILIIALAALLRISLIALGWPHSNADEGTMGIMAMHILYKGEHPIFFYGQNYMGTLEAYLGSAFFYLFGISVFTLRLAPLFFFVLLLLASSSSLSQCNTLPERANNKRLLMFRPTLRDHLINRTAR